MAEHKHLEISHGQLPPFMQGLEIPATIGDALAHAEERGASSKVLAYIETLPAAVFTSEEGLRHAFAHFREEEMPDIDPDAVLVAEDGTSS